MHCTKWLSRMTVWLVAAMLAVHPAVAAAQEKKTRRPNLILILADDFGYECVGANGGTSYKTPHLDKLAATGVRFTNCYVQPLCTPTRVQLMTGMYNVRNYVQFGLLDPKQITFAHLLKRLGYATCIVGKWQLGQGFGLPKHFGFDEYCLWQLNRRPPRYANPGLEINGKQVDYTDGEYGPDLVNDYGLDFISRKKDEPFCLYYSMMLTHGPFQPTPDSPTWDPKALGEKVNNNKKHFGDMTTYMDKLIGKLVARLEELGLRENTLILFVGDNGTGRGISSQLGDRLVHGGKGQSTAAGMHVPLIANWPAVMSKGQVVRDLVDSSDFLPTLLEAAGGTVPGELKIDGRSFLPQLRGEKGRPREWFYCWYAKDGGAQATHEFAAGPRYKLYRNGAFYDYSTDRDEQKRLDVRALPPEAAAAHRTLQNVLDEFNNARPAHLSKKMKKAKKGAGSEEM
jgi:arylsulfatase A